MNSDTFLLQDDARGSRAKYRFHLEGTEKRDTVLVVSIETFAEEIYHDVMRNKVLFPKPTISLVFSTFETVRFLAMLVEAASKHLAHIRKKLYLKDTLEDSIALTGSPYTISMQAHNAKVSAGGKEKNSARLVLIVLDEDDNQQIVLRLKRNKIVWMLQTIRDLYRTYVPKLALPFEDSRGQRRLLVKNIEYVALDNIWLHGRELQKFQDYIERVIFDFTYVTGDAKEFFRYRQISAHFSTVENVGMISLKKRNDQHQVYLDDEGNPVEFDFLITNEMVAKLFIALPLFFSKNTDAEVRHITEEVDSNTDKKNDTPSEENTEIENVESVHNETQLVLEDSKEIMEPERDGDYVINLIEAVIALKVDRSKKFNVKSGDGLMRFYVRYRDGVLNDDAFKVYGQDKSGNRIETAKLPLADMDLGIDWLNIFACIAESLHHKGRSEEYGITLKRKWNFTKRSLFGENVRYEVRVIIAEDNRAVALLIDQYIEEENEFTNIVNWSHKGRFRIPLFKEHIRSLLKGMIRLAGFYESYYFSKQVDVYDDETEKFTKKTFGIKRAKNTAGEEVVTFGTLGQKAATSKLNKVDRDHLFKSAYYRLLYGRWIPFVGDNVSISFDGYLTDLRHEYEIEFGLSETNGAGGSMAALAIIYGTIRPELVNNTEMEKQ